MKITLKQFWNSRADLAIHCNTEEKANKLLKKFDEMGKTWGSSRSYLDYNNWHLCGAEMCYTNQGTYCDCEYFKKRGYTIIEFEDIDFQEEKVETNFEHYIDEIVEGLKCKTILKIMFNEECGDKERICNFCPAGINLRKETKQYLLSPYEQPKIELKQWEYDFLTTIEDQRFDYNNRNMKMKELGYFKGVTDTSMRINEILRRAVIDL